MSAIQMKQEVINRYGEGSYEAGWFQFVFSRRPYDYLVRVYNDLMK
jgi:hypothetical protein